MLKHGGDLVGFFERYGRMPLDFSVNVNPLGMPEHVRKAAADALERAGEYPDPLCRKLRSAIARYHGVPMEWVLCGNGASELIFRLASLLKPKETLLADPCFLDYEAALRAYDLRIARYRMKREHGFSIQKDFLEKIGDDTELVFLCNPNNPTGKTIEPQLLRAVLRACGRKRAKLVADECFIDLLDDPLPHSLVSCLNDHPELVILRAFTKTFAMPGLRLGYCLCSDTALVAAMMVRWQIWPVSVVSEAAGIAALDCGDYLRKTRALLSAERMRLSSELKKRNLHVIGGEANFLFFHTEWPDFGGRLAEQGILIRDCRNYAGLEPGYYRAAVRKPAENDRLLAAMNRAFGEAAAALGMP